MSGQQWETAPLFTGLRSTVRSWLETGESQFLHLCLGHEYSRLTGKLSPPGSCKPTHRRTLDEPVGPVRWLFQCPWALKEWGAVWERLILRGRRDWSRKCSSVTGCGWQRRWRSIWLGDYNLYLSPVPIATLESVEPWDCKGEKNPSLKADKVSVEWMNKWMNECYTWTHTKKYNHNFKVANFISFRERKKRQDCL